MSQSPGFRAGEWVEVRSAEEILATLSSDGKVDNLPFMPEMLEFCGKRFKVYRRADKTCDTIHVSVSRRMENAVHLEGLRCSGAAHGGCQAECFLFWKEAWLKRPEEPPAKSQSGISRDQLQQSTRRPDQPDTFVCQATEMYRATSELPWYDLRQYYRELRSGNVSLGKMLKVLALAWYNVVARRLAPLGVKRHPYVAGLCTGKTPSATLGLQPGEIVRIRPKSEIMKTLGPDRKNRGLLFDVEMTPFCDGTYRVKGRVERIINEKTGAMMKIPRDCILLDGVHCGGMLSKDRLFCSRSIPAFWREIWLERAGETDSITAGPKHGL